MELIVIGGFIEVFEALEENDIKIVGYILTNINSKNIQIMNGWV